MFNRNPLVPELIVTSLSSSLDFWVKQLGFYIAYQRAEEGFAYLDLQGAQIMLEQYDPGAGQWVTAALERPFGRGVNLQIDVPAAAPILDRLAKRGWPLFQALEDIWYRAGDVEAGQRQFIVQDPDGYLVRLVERLGERPCKQA